MRGGPYRFTRNTMPLAPRTATPVRRLDGLVSAEPGPPVRLGRADGITINTSSTAELGLLISDLRKQQ